MISDLDLVKKLIENHLLPNIHLLSAAHSLQELFKVIGYYDKFEPGIYLDLFVR